MEKRQKEATAVDDDFLFIQANTDMSDVLENKSCVKSIICTERGSKTFASINIGKLLILDQKRKFTKLVVLSLNFSGTVTSKWSCSELFKGIAYCPLKCFSIESYQLTTSHLDSVSGLKFFAWRDMRGLSSPIFPKTARELTSFLKHSKNLEMFFYGLRSKLINNIFYLRVIIAAVEKHSRLLEGGIASPLLIAPDMQRDYLCESISNFKMKFYFRNLFKSQEDMFSKIERLSLS